MRLRDRVKFATYKRRGEWAELVFITIVQGLGFNVAKPWGDSAKYDVSLEKNGWFLRVQVKSTECWVRSAGSYLCQLHGFDKRLYIPREVDYFACYVVPEDRWYIFPVARLLGMSTGGLTVIRQDVVPIKTGSIRLGFGIEPCKRRRDKSAPCKSLQPICTFAPLLRRRRS